MRLQVVTAALLVIACGVSVQAARAAASPPTLIYQAEAYQNIVDDDNLGDLLVIIRYELDVALWCAELENIEGCGDSPPDPEEPTSLPQGAVNLSLYDYVAGTSTLRSFGRVPRIDHALGGIYLSSGHGLTWGDTDVEACVEASATLYDPAASSCLAVTWNGAGDDMDDQRDALGQGVRQMLLTLQDERAEPQYTYVSSVSKITVAGQVFSREAFGWLDRVAAEYFQTGGQPMRTGDYEAPSGEPGLQTSIDADPTAVAFRESLDTVATSYFGMSGDTLATIGAVSLGVMVAIFTMAIGKSPFLASVGFFIPVTVGVWIHGPTVGVLFTIVLIVFMAAVFWLTKSKVPG